MRRNGNQNLKDLQNLDHHVRGNEENLNKIENELVIYTIKYFKVLNILYPA